jgi:4'-phosphopantetheinyl transferase
MKVSPKADRGCKIVGREVHAWPVLIRGPNAVVAECESFLSPEEITRAAAFVFEDLRRSFLLSRGALRFLIGRYLRISPEKVLLIHNSHGKPSLAHPKGTSKPFEFNASHSGEIALFAFTTGCELGVDVEQVRPLEGMARVASQFFSREESEDLFSLPLVEREQAFFLCWTRKEAYVKAIGHGLSIPLDSFQVTLRPGEPARFLHLDHDASLAQAWMLHNLEVTTGYAAALAYRDTPRPVELQPVLEMEELLSLSCRTAGGDAKS